MKKIVMAIAVLVMAAPALAADWSFYGSQRMETYWVHRDFGDATVNGEDDDDGLIWNFQGNSRLGAKVKADKVRGHIEIGLKGNGSGDLDVGTRRAYGTWKFADGAELVVGKDYTPIVQWISGQVFDWDNGLAGIGTNDGFRVGQIRLELGNFKVAAITANSSNASAAFDGDRDIVLPKFEGAYTLQLGKFYSTFTGGIQYFQIEQTDASVNQTDDIDIVSYILGLELGVDIGAFYIKTCGAWGQNWTDANWNNYGYTSNSNAAAALNTAGDDTEDAKSWMAALVLGYKVSDALLFETGIGYRSDDNDAAQDKDTAWNAYLQAVITLAPGVYVVPEVGYFDYMDDNAGNNEGYSWYAGAKWQIDF
jgi:hypothetical protein